MATWAGIVYVAFVVDLYSRAIVGWSAATNKRTKLVLDALQMALWRRDRAGHTVEKGLIHHSDAGSPVHVVPVHHPPRRCRHRRPRQRTDGIHDRIALLI
ncbi:DDE-type integrase/transposase/recombinase [Micromonospora sp. DR5-3]|uniref:DDE-type integrase/transposase/recombinase n=1 Tax=unclassified Micromonospora TaxID=2617518 RepID=UPI0011D849B7|nr:MULTISPECIES: DDE-type integrase/transposase/recombinase [unclassified Micromonospora]MCW3816208.1 DDE-type integrase/transposase/recombinase [Micromonospora sp. DR5-3]TYC23970.1 DDE-type integrase/transposase/recombinase [Micromonospora sp. MP36]